MYFSHDFLTIFTLAAVVTAMPIPSPKATTTGSQIRSLAHSAIDKFGVKRSDWTHLMGNYGSSVTDSQDEEELDGKHTVGEAGPCPRFPAMTKDILANLLFSLDDRTPRTT